MRAQRQKIKLLELGGADEDEIITARGRYMTTSSEYTRFSKEMGLPQQRERVTFDNLYNIGQKNYYKPVEKSTDSGIIKLIDVDDYDLVTYGKEFSDEVKDCIINTMKSCEDSGGFIISEISAKSLPKTNTGVPVLQIEPLSNGLLQLNLNTYVFAKRSLTEINELFKNTEKTVVNSLEEAIIHESGHVKSIKGKTTAEIKSFYEELSNKHIKEVSYIAY